MVSIKTTRESNIITVLTESEATKRALLAIKEIQITDQQPLAVQADLISLEPFGTDETSWKYIYTGHKQ
ncbi:unnamed protein product [Ixodes pacificus]